MNTKISQMHYGKINNKITQVHAPKPWALTRGREKETGYHVIGQSPFSFAADTRSQPLCYATNVDNTYM
jgi:hypothetical protein